MSCVLVIRASVSNVSIFLCGVNFFSFTGGQSLFSFLIIFLCGPGTGGIDSHSFAVWRGNIVRWYDEGDAAPPFSCISGFPRYFLHETREKKNQPVHRISKSFP